MLFTIVLSGYRTEPPKAKIKIIRKKHSSKKKSLNTIFKFMSENCSLLSVVSTCTVYNVHLSMTFSPATIMYEIQKSWPPGKRVMILFHSKLLLYTII